MKSSRKKMALIGIVVLTIGSIVYFAKPSNSDTPPPSSEHAEGEEGKGIELSDAKIAVAGIELATAMSGEIKESIRLNGIIQPNHEALVQVTPRFPGVTRELLKRVGDQVDKGDLLARVESNTSLTTYELRAPISGTVIDRQASLGEYVSEQKPAFVIADLSQVWADFSVYRKDLSRIKVGNELLIDFEDGNEPVRSKVSYLAPVTNSETQSAVARAIIDNHDRARRPGLFIVGRVLLNAKPAAVTVKPSALQSLNEQTVVFVREGKKFEARQVQIGARDPEAVEILSGVSVGDAYAAKNSFIIKAEIAKGEGGHEH